jgi:hypothetical protein
MLKKEEITDEVLINLIVSRQLQEGLVNEIYPEMRRVIGCINHNVKEVVILIIYEKELSDKCLDGMQMLESEVLPHVPDDYQVNAKIVRLDFPDWYEFGGDDWYCFFAYFKHEEVDFDSVRKVPIDLLNAPSVWD